MDFGRDFSARTELPATRLVGWIGVARGKGTGFVQPVRPHEHGHVDVSCLNLAGTFHDPCPAPDEAIRAVVHWELRESRPTGDAEEEVRSAWTAQPPWAVWLIAPCESMGRKYRRST